MLTQDQIKTYLATAEREAESARARGDDGTAADFDVVAARWRSQLAAVPAAPDPEGLRLFEDQGRPVGNVYRAPAAPGAPPVTPAELGYDWAPAPQALRMAPPPPDEMIFELPPIFVPWARAARRVEGPRRPAAPAKAPASQAAAPVVSVSPARRVGMVAVPIAVLVGAGLLVRRVLG